jgi:hypothetical protein
MHRWPIATLGLLGVLALGVSGGIASPSGHGTSRLAPNFPRHDTAGWINSPPLSMRALRGQVVVLDVWTFG